MSDLRDWEPLSANGATTATYTPQGATPDDPDTVDNESAGVAVDEGWHLLARATYDTDQTAVGISDYPVRANVHDNLNNSPDFAAADTPRTVPENIEVGMPVGDAVDVDRNEDNDILTYELVTKTTGDNGNGDVMELDLPFFYIDKDTGQIRVKKPLNFEGHDDPGSQSMWLSHRSTRSWSGPRTLRARPRMKTTVTTSPWSSPSQM